MIIPHAVAEICLKFLAHHASSDTKTGSSGVSQLHFLVHNLIGSIVDHS